VFKEEQAFVVFTVVVPTVAPSSVDVHVHSLEHEVKANVAIKKAAIDEIFFIFNLIFRI
jgi:translation elongation factor EF-1beta